MDLTTAADRLEPYAPSLEAIAAARNLKLERLEFPIPDLGVVDDAQYDTLTAAIDAALDHGGVFVHCWGGVGRTGTVVGCHLAKQGLSYDQVMNQLSSLRQSTRKATRRIPETGAQAQVIHRAATR